MILLLAVQLSPLPSRTTSQSIGCGSFRYLEHEYVHRHSLKLIQGFKIYYQSNFSDSEQVHGKFSQRKYIPVFTKYSMQYRDNIKKATSKWKSPFF